MSEEYIFPKYGSIENLYRSNEVLEHEVVVTEKIHGTNCRVMWGPGGLYVGGRSHACKTPKMEFANRYDGFGFTFYFENHPSLEVFHNTAEFDNYVFHGEFCGAGIQKGVRYSDTKEFRVFDVRHPVGYFVHWDEAVRICAAVGFKIVPVVFRGMATADSLKDLLDVNSQCAIENKIELEDNIAEGIVIKPVQPTKDHRGNWIRAKYKSQKWAENAKAPKIKLLNPETAKVQEAAREFAAQVVNVGRVHVIIDHITRDGNTEINMRRTPDFLRAFVNDIMDEHKEVYKALERRQQNMYNKVIGQSAVKLWQEYVMNL